MVLTRALVHWFRHSHSLSAPPINEDHPQSRHSPTLSSSFSRIVASLLHHHQFGVRSLVDDGDTAVSCPDEFQTRSSQYTTLHAQLVSSVSHLPFPLPSVLLHPLRDGRVSVVPAVESDLGGDATTANVLRPAAAAEWQMMFQLHAERRHGLQVAPRPPPSFASFIRRVYISLLFCWWQRCIYLFLSFIYSHLSVAYSLLGTHVCRKLRFAL